MEIRLDTSYSFNLEFTLCCGQAFRWNKHGEWWYGVVKKRPLKIRQISDRLEFEDVEATFVEDYFGLSDDLPEIFRQIGKDKIIKSAINKFRGLRILRQDPWECLISYICATYKNISAIKQMVSNLSKRFGEKVGFDGLDFYTFPTVETLSKASCRELAACGLGYRARYVAETAKKVCTEGLKLEELRKMRYEEAKGTLQSLSGVGLKVADCVLLFSLGKLEAFPVDVWIKRAILKYYPEHFAVEFVGKVSSSRSPTSSEYEKLNQFGRRYFGEYAGYAQEYLYHYERTKEKSEQLTNGKPDSENV